jgi:magnesium chelatase family protein
MQRHGRLDAAGHQLLYDGVRRFALSARGYERVRKVARTIADLSGDDAVRDEHVAEALQFRSVIC